MKSRQGALLHTMQVPAASMLVSNTIWALAARASGRPWEDQTRPDHTRPDHTRPDGLRQLHSVLVSLTPEKPPPEPLCPLLVGTSRRRRVGMEVRHGQLRTVHRTVQRGVMAIIHHTRFDHRQSSPVSVRSTYGYSAATSRSRCQSPAASHHILLSRTREKARQQRSGMIGAG